MPAKPARDVAPLRPAAVHGFEGVQRYWESSTGLWTARILPGEYYVTHTAEVITTVLGSCVSACIRDPHAGCGGMNHFMLPEDGEGGGSWNESDHGASARYGSYAMERLINGLFKLGARRSHLEIKLFGGGRILPTITDVGSRNVDFVRAFLKLEGLSIVAEDLGDVYPRRVVYFPLTGQVRLRRLPAVDSERIASSDSRYRVQLADDSQDGAVELFD